MTDYLSKNAEKIFPPSYIVIKFNRRIKSETAKWLIEKITKEKKKGGAELMLRCHPSSESSENLIVHVSANMRKLLELAEELEVRKCDKQGNLREFTMDEMEEFTDIEGQDDFLTMSEKQTIVRHEIENIRALSDESSIVGYPNYPLYEGQSIMMACLHYGLVKKMYPLHDEEAVRKLGARWYKRLFEQQPYGLMSLCGTLAARSKPFKSQDAESTVPHKIASVFTHLMAGSAINIVLLYDIRVYFGESVALYFQFIGFYTSSLIVPTLLGFLQMLVDPGTMAIFSILNIACATIFLEFWRRKCSELAYVWGTITMTSFDEPRPNFRGVMGVDAVTGKLLPQAPRFKTHIKMYCVSLPLVFICMLGAFIIMLLSFWLEDQLKTIPKAPIWLLYLPSVVYAGLIYAMNMAYRRFANFLTEWENHRTQSQFDRHRVTKLVLFEFVNNFMSLFYIAFVVQDMELLRYQLATLLIVLQSINNIQEAIVPFLLKCYSNKVANLRTKKTPSKLIKDKITDLTKIIEDIGIEELDPEDSRIKQAITEGMMEQYDDPYDDYLEMFVQFGYVYLFSAVYPMAAFWAVLNNIIEIRCDAFKLCRVYQRPIARKVKDTGAWQRAFQILSTLSVVTNCALLSLNPVLRSRAPDLSAESWFFLFVILEHLLLGIRQVIHYAIPDKPEWVRLALARGNYKAKQALKLQTIIHSQAHRPINI